MLKSIWKQSWKEFKADVKEEVALDIKAFLFAFPVLVVGFATAVIFWLIERGL